jgi:hypothetical protein
MVRPLLFVRRSMETGMHDSINIRLGEGVRRRN